MGQRNHVLNGVKMPPRKGAIFGVVWPLKSIVILCCDACSKRDHLVLNNTAAADCSAPTSRCHVHYIAVVQNPSPLLRCGLSSNFLTTCLFSVHQCLKCSRHGSHKIFEALPNV